MAFYKINKQVASNIVLILDQAVIKGSDSVKVILIQKILGGGEEHVEFSDDLRAFLVNTINEVQIRGRFAIAIVEVLNALSNPFDKKPEPEPTPPKSLRTDDKIKKGGVNMKPTAPPPSPPKGQGENKDSKSI